jgi:hypothetical protein
LRELTVEKARALLARPEELVAVRPDATGERLDVIVPRHLERRGGWEIVVPEIDFGSDYPPFLVMGKELG